MISMRSVGLGLGLALLAGACGTSSSDPCDGAKSGDACLWAGTGVRGYNGGNPKANRLDSILYYPTNLTFGPDGRAYIVDFNNHRIRRVEKDGSVVSLLGTDVEGDGGPMPADADRLPVCAPAGLIGTDVSMNHPTDAKFGPDGMLYIAAWHNNKIRVLDPNTDISKTFAGDTYSFAPPFQPVLGDNGPVCMAGFDQPKTVIFGPDGAMYILDQRNSRVRKVSPPPDQTITTIVGNGQIGFAGDGGQAIDAQIGMETQETPQPTGALAIKDNKLYLADTKNHRIRMIDLASGTITCIAGASPTPTAGYVDGPALQAQFNEPDDLEFGPDGRLYIADRLNHAIRALDLTTMTVSTVVGNGQKCETEKQKCPDLAPALKMELNEPQGIEFDAQGNLYIADTYNHRILKVIK